MSGAVTETTRNPARCIHCGDERTYVRREGGVRRETSGYRVACDGCGARGERCDTAAAAILGWNRVARLPAQLEETRRALQALADQLHPGVV